MNRLHTVSLAVAALVLGGIVHADDKPLKGDMAKLQGKWVGKGGPNQDWLFEYNFEGDTCTTHYAIPNGNEGNTKRKFKIDEDAKPHKTIDWIAAIPEKNGRSDSLGIYEFDEAGNLKVCNAIGRGPRPKMFRDDKQFGPGTITFRREK